MLKQNLFRGTVMGVAIIVFSSIILVVLGFTGYAVHALYSRHQAVPFESMRTWSLDVQHPLDFSVTANTKVVDGQIYADYMLQGWPGYMSSNTRAARDPQAYIAFQFFDKDGFKLYEKDVNLNDFAIKLNETAMPSGLEFQGIEPMEVQKYARFDRIGLMWNLDTTPPEKRVSQALNLPAKDETKYADPCAPGQSRAERLKRLAQFGQVRETGLNTFSAGEHTVQFLTGADVLECR